MYQRYLDEFLKLEEEKQEILKEWILENCIPKEGRYCSNSSYNLKHYFEHAPNGFYITHNQFKGAMISCGFKKRYPKKVESSWRFNIDKKSPIFTLPYRSNM